MQDLHEQHLVGRRLDWCRTHPVVMIGVWVGCAPLLFSPYFIQEALFGKALWYLKPLGAEGVAAAVTGALDRAGGSLLRR
jgi:hypothetical protein